MLTKPCVLEIQSYVQKGWGWMACGERKRKEVRGVWEEVDTLAWSWRTPRGSLEQARARMDEVEGQGRWRLQLGHIGLSFQNAFFFFF